MTEIARQTVIVEWDADYTQFERAMKDGEVRFQTSTKNINNGLKEVSKEADKVGTTVEKNMDKAAKSSGKFTGALRAVGTAAAGMFVALGATEVAQRIVGFFTDSSAAAREFETSLSNLSAITGATGEDLKFYEEQARLIGTTTTKSATEAVEAFKLIGSAKPDLLANKEALAAVTAEAVTLAEASGLSLPEAATALTSALNQFSLPAEDAGRVINILAAGAKAGAAEIPETQQALEKFGVAASNAGVSVEESVGAIQLLAEFGLKGAEAGTSLRNVLSRLAAVDALPKEALDQLEKFGVDLSIVRDETLPTSERLAELGKISGDATALVKVFGQENQVAGAIVLGNVDKFQKYTEAVTGTQDAIEQARVNTENFEAEQQKLRNAFADLQIGIGSALNEALLPLVKGFTQVLLALKELPAFIAENKVAIGGLVAGTLIWNAELIKTNFLLLKNAATLKIEAIAKGASTIAQNLLNAAMTANPIGLVVKALALLVTGFTIAYQKSETFRNFLAGVGNVAKELFEIVKETIGGFIEGFRDITQGNIVEGLKKIGKAMITANPIGLAVTQGKRLGNSFSKGFEEAKIAEQMKRVVENATAQVDALGANWVKTRQESLLWSNKATKAVEENTEATQESNKEDQKKVTLLGALNKQIEEQSKKLENLKPGSDAFDKQAELVAGLIAKAKEWKEAIADALNPPTEEQRLERVVKNIQEMLDKADPGTAYFDELRRLLNKATNDLDLYRQAKENALNPAALARIDQGQISAAQRELERLGKTLQDALISGDDSLAKRIERQLKEVRIRLLGFKVGVGDQNAINEYAGLMKEQRESRDKGIKDAVLAASGRVAKTLQEDKEQRDKNAADIAEQEKKLTEEIKGSALSALQSLNDIAAGQVQVYEEAVGRQTERIERFKELSRTGSSEQLAIEEERLARLTELQERAAARQRRIAEAQLLINQAVTVSESVKAIAQAFGQGGALGIITGLATSAALALTLASTASQISGLFGGLPKFRDGSEFIQGKGTGTSDSILARVSKGERIVPYRENMEIARIGGIPNKKLPEAVAAWHSGPVIIDTIRQGNESMLAEMQEVRRELTLSRLESQKTRVSILATRKGLAAMVSEQAYVDKFARR